MEKLQQISHYHLLDDGSKNFLNKIIDTYQFSLQELRFLCVFGIDLLQWKKEPLKSVFENVEKSLIQAYPQIQKASLKTKIFDDLRRNHEALKKAPLDYSEFKNSEKHKRTQHSTHVVDTKANIVGACPVYSEKTVCCNLQTIDAVESCAFDCSYCSIQSFYNEGKIGVHKDLKKYLDQIEIDPKKTYHFGTGQSSDSLFWQNKFGALKDLFEFARNHPNVILELKTKSDKIDYLLDNDIPKNVITTWSINPQVVIDNEEHFTASLETRLNCAKLIAQKNNLVGFHFHPMFNLENLESIYGEIAKTIMSEFTKNQVALISMGTLTFTKKVMAQIRSRKNFNTQVLKLPESEIAGKFSYDISTKEKMFKSLFHNFKDWHNEVFFYLCMEEKAVWDKCFGFCYSDNMEFEKDMHESYFKKINNLIIT